MRDTTRHQADGKQLARKQAKMEQERTEETENLVESLFSPFPPVQIIGLFGLQHQ